MPYTQHSCIDTPSDDALIWRYLSVDRFLSGLQNGLYFTRIDNFRDPLEGTLPPVNKMLHDIQMEHQKIEAPTRARLLEEMESSTRRRSLVNCWAMSEHENALMWRVYAHGGVAIRTTVGHLKEAFSDLPEHCYIGKVKYIDYNTNLADLQRNILTPAFYKNIAYKSEQEVRVCITPRECVKQEGDKWFAVDFPDKGRYYNTKKKVMSHILVHYDMKDHLLKRLERQIGIACLPEQTASGTGGDWGVARSQLYRYPLDIDVVPYNELLKYQEWLKTQPPGCFENK